MIMLLCSMVRFRKLTLHSSLGFCQHPTCIDHPTSSHHIPSLHCMNIYSVSSRARSSDRHLRARCLKSENALQVLQSSSVFVTQWLHRFEGAWYASIVVASQIGHALQISGAGSVRSARRSTTSTRYGCLRYLIYFAVWLTRYSIEWRNYGPSYSISVTYKDSLRSINPTTYFSCL